MFCLEAHIGPGGTMKVVRGVCVRVADEGGGWDEVLLRCRGLTLLDACDVSGLLAFGG